jgi:hypothetical protein
MPEDDTPERKAIMEERERLKTELLSAQQAKKLEKAELTELAEASMGAGWTQKILEGDARYDKEDKDTPDDQLAAVTHGLVSGDEFKRRKAEIEAAAEKAKLDAEEAETAAAAEQERAAAEQKEKKKATKTRKRKAQISLLSFGAEDE